MDSDYGDYVEIGAAEAEASLKKAREFVSAADQVLSELPGQSGGRRTE